MSLRNYTPERLKVQLSTIINNVDCSNLKNNRQMSQIADILSDLLEEFPHEDAQVSPSSKNQGFPKRLINIDWLDIAIETGSRFNEIMDTWQNQKGAPLQRKEKYSIRSYKRHYQFYWYDLPIFTIWFDGNGAIKKESGKIHFENWVFYHEKREYFIKYPFEEFGAIFKRIIRIDVASDMLENQVTELIPVKTIDEIPKGIVNGDLVFSRRIAYAPYYKGAQLTGMSFGKNPRRLQIYNKTYDLNRKEKPYISEVHLKHFGEGAIVWRVEGQLSQLGSSVLRDDDENELNIELQSIFDEFILLQLLNYVLIKNFDLRQNDNIRVSRCTKLLNTDITTMYVKVVQKDEIRAKKMIVSGLIKDSVSLVSENDRINQLRQAARITRRYRIAMHFYQRLQDNNLEKYFYILSEHMDMSAQQEYDKYVQYSEIR